jgi:transcription initiation factor TFIIB
MKGYQLSEYDITYIDALNLSSKTQERAKTILVEAVHTGVTARKRSASLIAAALYIACILEGERRTQHTIGQVTGVSVHTIHARYQELVGVLAIRRGES